MSILEITVLSAIAKLVPIVTRNRSEIDNFVINLGLRHGTTKSAKMNAFFKFVFRFRLDNKVQNMVQQETLTSTIPELITSLKRANRPVGNSSCISNRLTSLVQSDESVREYADKIQQLVAELNEVQIAEIGEADGASIVRANNILAFNTFKNGIREHELVHAILASRGKTFTEALETAEFNMKQ